MTARTAAPRLASGVGVEVCRLTVRSAERSCDLALPVSAAVGEVLPLIVPDAEPEESKAGYVLQRLGGPPLDPGATPESLGLRDGDVLYVNPMSDVLPEAEFDDVSVGVAQVVAARSDQWRSEFTGPLLLGAAGVAVIAFCAVAVHSPAHWLAAFSLVLAAGALTVWAALAPQLRADKVTVVVSGVAACAVGGIAGLSTRDAAGGLFTLDRKALVALGLGAVLPALILCVARLPLTIFGTLVGCGVTAALGAGLAGALHWDATRTAALLAVIVFATGQLHLRIILRATRLWVPQLPRSTQELQQDIEPEAQAVVTQRTERAVGMLNSLFMTAAVLNIVACALLARQPGWIGLTLGGVLCAAVLLRARALTGAWQRTALALSGATGFAFLVVTQSATADPGSRALLLLGLLLVAAGLVAVAQRLPRRRLLPVWGYIADLLETWTAIALVPLLLQLLHVYAHLRGLIG
jgi:type VII secretion integral membrane protein EccD